MKDGNHAKSLDLRGVRLRKGNLESAVQRYDRSEDGRRILLVSTVHLAEPDHYVELRKVVDKAVGQGFVVHSEGSMASDRASTEVPSTAAEREAFQRACEGLDALYQDALRNFDLNWVHREMSAMTPDPAWLSIDATLLDVIRLFGPRNAGLITPAANAIRLTADPGTARWRLARRMFVLSYLNSGRSRPPLAVRAIGKLMGRGGPPKWAYDVMFPFRESIAARAALAADGDLVLLWHGAHFPGIGGALLRNDFRLTDVQWFTAIHRRAALNNRRRKTS